MEFSNLAKFDFEITGRRGRDDDRSLLDKVCELIEENLVFITKPAGSRVEVKVSLRFSNYEEGKQAVECRLKVMPREILVRWEDSGGFVFQGIELHNGCGVFHFPVGDGENTGILKLTID